MKSVEPDKLTVEEVSQGCLYESQLYRQGQSSDSPLCLELFRRAIVQQSEEAWERLYEQYRPQIIRWVRAHPTFPQCTEESEYFVNSTWTRFWQAVTPAKFAEFYSLGSLLQYLKMCAAGAILDHVRGRQKQVAVRQLDEAAGSNQPVVSSVEQVVARQIDSEQLWQLIQQQLKNEREIVAIRGIFLFAMTPRDIVAQHPNLFANKNPDIYGVVENVLKRLSRRPELRRLLNDD